MASQAGYTIIGISRSALMLVVHIGLIVFVTADAGENGKIGRGVMTLRAQCPSVFVVTAVNRKILAVVIKGRWRPGSYRMARFTFLRKLCGQVIRIGCGIILGAMAPVTGVWCAGVIPFMAQRTIVTDGGMRSGKRIIVIMDREGSRDPAGIGGMTIIAVDRQGQALMIGIGGGVISGLMAGGTAGGGIVVSGGMAFCTKGGCVCPGQWKAGG